jgi:hypothetical protein
MKSFKEFLSIIEEKSIPLGKGQSYGSKEYQDELQKRKAKARKDAEEKQRQTSSELHQERTRGRGIRATEGGVKGWIKGGKFTPGNW